MSRTVFVDVNSIDWDIGDYEEFDENGNVVDYPDLDLPSTLQSVELTLEDYEENTPTSEMDDGYVEEVLMDGLTEEYGFCIDFINWEYVKYRIEDNEGKWEVKDVEDGNKVVETFDTFEEASAFEEAMLNLMNKN